MMKLSEIEAIIQEELQVVFQEEGVMSSVSTNIAASAKQVLEKVYDLYSTLEGAAETEEEQTAKKHVHESMKHLVMAMRFLNKPQMAEEE